MRAKSLKQRCPALCIIEPFVFLRVLRWDGKMLQGMQRMSKTPLFQLNLTTDSITRFHFYHEASTAQNS